MSVERAVKKLASNLVQQLHVQRPVAAVLKRMDPAVMNLIVRPQSVVSNHGVVKWLGINFVLTWHAPFLCALASIQLLPFPHRQRRQTT